MSREQYAINAYLTQNTNVPYVSRQDLLYERRKREREIDIERAKQNIASKEKS